MRVVLILLLSINHYATTASFEKISPVKDLDSLFHVISVEIESCDNIGLSNFQKDSFNYNV